jgi:hypothetical protein
MNERLIDATFQRALAARRAGHPEVALKLLALLPLAGSQGAAVAITAGRILLHDIGDAGRALPFFASAARDAPRSRAARQLLRLARQATASA